MISRARCRSFVEACLQLSNDPIAILYPIVYTCLQNSAWSSRSSVQSLRRGHECCQETRLFRLFVPASETRQRLPLDAWLQLLSQSYSYNSNRKNVNSKFIQKSDEISYTFINEFFEFFSYLTDENECPLYTQLI